MLRSWIVVAVAAGVAIAATVDGVLSSGSNAAKAPPKRASGNVKLVGPDVPPAGDLPGTLVLTSGTDCRVRTIVFSGPRVSEPGVTSTCRVWPSPSGEYAVVSTSESTGAPEAGELALLNLRDPAKIVRQLGAAVGEPSWAPSGDTVTFCTPEGFLLIENAGTGGITRAPGCGPRYTPDGHLLAVPAGVRPDILLRDGSVLLNPTDLADGVPGADPAHIGILDYDEARDGILAVAVAREGQSGGGIAALELWLGDKSLGSFIISSGFGPYGRPQGNLVRFSPDGQELAVGERTPQGLDPVTFFDLRLRRVSLRVDSQSGFAWSPDGAWLAVAQDDGVAFYSRATGDPVFRLPVSAEGLGWVRNGLPRG